MVSSVATELNQEVTSASSSRSETESALNLKMDEVENNRHSGMGKYLLKKTTQQKNTQHSSVQKKASNTALISNNLYSRFTYCHVNMIDWNLSY